MRVIDSDRSNPSIIAVENQNDRFFEESFLDLEQATTTPGNLTDTDVISRQLFTDYLALKSSTEATQENLGSLAGQYANSLLVGGGVSATVPRSQIKSAADTDENLQVYDQKIASLRARYRASAGVAGMNEYSDVFSADFIRMMGNLSLQYKRAADELLTFEVPSSLVDNHFQLINNYLMSSERLWAISQIGIDPISALSAMSEQSKNAQTEEGLIANIKIRLMSRGLLSNL